MRPLFGISKREGAPCRGDISPARTRGRIRPVVKAGRETLRGVYVFSGPVIGEPSARPTAPISAPATEPPLGLAPFCDAQTPRPYLRPATQILVNSVFILGFPYSAIPSPPPDM